MVANCKALEKSLYSILRYLYSLVITITLPLIFLRLLWRSLRVSAYRNGWLQRLGIFRGPAPKPHGIWIHAVSVGEVVAATPLIIALLAKDPALTITVTTTTPTGAQRLHQSLGAKVIHYYLPYDLPWAIRALIKHIQPQCLINMETELWPNVLYVCKTNNIPLLIVNARISDRSIKGYLRIKWIVAKMLQQVTFVAAQSQLDAERFLQLGMRADSLKVTGNLKYDVQLSEQHVQKGMQLKTTLEQRAVWVAASTHSGEEDLILKLFAQLKNKFPQCLLILVPRHPDRFNQVAALIEKYKLQYVRRSQNVDCTRETSVLLGDTMGELNIFYAAADLAFVGGSLVNVGGHNLLEPATFALPIVTGAYLSNFQDIADKLVQAGGVVVVNDLKQLTATVSAWLADPELRTMLGKNAQQVVQQNKGATAKTMLIIASFLHPSQDLV